MRENADGTVARGQKNPGSDGCGRGGVTLYDQIIQLRVLAQELRVEAGQDSPEPHGVDHLRQAADRLSEHYLSRGGLTVLPGGRDELQRPSSRP